MLKVTDAHIHFWDPERLRYDWLANVPAIRKRFLPADLGPASEQVKLEKIVFVQAGAHPTHALDEVVWVTGLAARDGRIQGIVADMGRGSGRDLPGYWAELDQYPLVKGVRHSIQSESDEFAAQTGFIRQVRQLADFDLSFDIVAQRGQLRAVRQLVAACPAVRFVLDHCGNPDVKGGVLEPWAGDIAALAEHQHVFCKLSGLATQADRAGWKLDDFRPYIDHILDAFGPGRVMFGGDWPVSLLAVDSWQAWLDIARGSLDGFAENDLERIFYQNAVDFYRLA